MPKAYFNIFTGFFAGISICYNENRVTITAPAASMFDLTQIPRTAGLSTYELGLYGSFHSAGNTTIVNQLVSFCRLKCGVPTIRRRVADDAHEASDRTGGLLKRGPLHSHALRSILLEPPH